MSLKRRILRAVFLTICLATCRMLLAVGWVLSLVSSKGRYLRMLGLATVAMRNVETGATDKAKRRAKELLRLSGAYEGDMFADIAIHKGNLVLGRVALRDGDVEAAKDYLLRSAKLGDSPALSSFGPNMSLAKELLEAGEVEVVLGFFGLCGDFWVMGSAHLNRWTKTVLQGQMPRFGPNLIY